MTEHERTTIDKIIALIRSFVHGKSFGEITITFQNGVAHTVSTRQTHKL